MSGPSNANVRPPFLIGANLPWVHYGIDFGANAWRPDGGVAQPEELAQVEATFGQLSAAGVNYVRWFLFCDGRAGLDFNDRGRPCGLDRFVFRDIDAALASARQHGIRVMFVLFDFLWCDVPRVVRGVQLCGRTHLLLGTDTRRALLEDVVRPVLDRYGNNPSIFAWDIMNEPEWITTLTRKEIREFLNEAVALVHSSTLHPATIGSAGTRWRDFYRDLDLDFYQVHWYDSLKHQPPLETPVEGLGFDRPVLLGEFPTRGSRKSSQEIVEAARTAGYSGAFYWSVLSKDKSSDDRRRTIDDGPTPITPIPPTPSPRIASRRRRPRR
jgi:hypothetical protein